MTDEPRLFRLVEPAWIPVADGVRLSARLWIPEAAEAAPVPVVLEYIPYRTRDRYRALDDHYGRRLAEGGIAFARVDIRGSGDSGGLLADEYLESEQQDALAVIAWLAAQPWCSGAVGMRGLSWGGFAALQVAALRPPALKAILPICASDRRFANDAHFIGGAPGLTSLKWAAGFELVMAAPPDPEIRGPDWEAIWRRRLEAVPSIAARWLSHPFEDDYWRHGSVGLDPAAIQCPVYLVGGWADPYAESLLRLLESLPRPKKALIGPWGHIYPDLADIGPGLDWAAEELRWWRQWLVGEDTGVMQGPQLRFYMPYATPSEVESELPGRWAGEAMWPSPSVEAQVLHLAPGALQSAAPSASRLTCPNERVVGLAKPERIPYAAAERPGNQAADDEASLRFDLASLSEDLEIVGVPRLTVTVVSDRPAAQLAVRLCEVTPDGRSWLVGWGLLDLAFRDGLGQPPRPLEPGEPATVELALSAVAHRFKAGSTLRLTLSPGLWPMAWPSPEPVRLAVHLGEAHLVLPVRPIPPGEPDMPIATTPGGFSRGGPSLHVQPEDSEGWVRVEGAWPATSGVVAATGAELTGSGPDMALAWRPREPLSCSWTVRQTSGYRRGDWDCELRVEIGMTADAATFHIRERMTALKDGAVIFDRERQDAIPRTLPGVT